MRFLNLKTNKGFTLTELVVTTAIMGTLAAVAVPSYLETQAKAKAEKTAANIASMGVEVGKKFNELAAEFGSVQLGTGVTETEQDIVNVKQILIAEDVGSNGSAVNFFWCPNTEGDEFALFPGGVSKSPFGDNEYLMTVKNPGSVTYSVDESGNVSVTVTKAVLTIADPQDKTNLTFTFAY